MRTLLVLATLSAYGKDGKEQAFDLTEYCEGSVACYNDFDPSWSTTYSGDTGASYSYSPTVESCVQSWELQRDYYTEQGCGADWDALEFCFANEELSCIYGQYASTACLGETRALSDCVLALVTTSSSY